MLLEPFPFINIRQKQKQANNPSVFEIEVMDSF